MAKRFRVVQSAGRDGKKILKRTRFKRVAESSAKLIKKERKEKGLPYKSVRVEEVV